MTGKGGSVVDHFDLVRFLDAQAPSFETALSELRAGRKRTHWMWYIFPQISGLGASPMAQKYAIQSLDEAAAFLAHPILGRRLNACVAALAALEERDPESVLGSVDAMKLRSSLTLFQEAGGGDIFGLLLRRWFGDADDRTLSLLRK